MIRTLTVIFIIGSLLLDVNTTSAQWEAINNGLSPFPNLNNVFYTAGTLYGGSSQATGRAAAYSSTNNGTQWDSAGTGLPAATDVRTFAVSRPNLICGTFGMGTFRSTNNGTSWVLSNTGIGSAIVLVVRQVGTVLIGGGSNQFWISTDNGVNWTPSSSGMNLTTGVTCFTEHGTGWVVGTNGNGAFISSSNGTSWTPISTGLTGNGLRIFSLVSIGGRLVAGAFNGGVYVSTNNGGNWAPSNTGITANSDVRSLIVSGNNLLAGTFNTGTGVFLSTNYGSSWTTFNTGLDASMPISGFALGGGYIFASNYNGGAWRRPITDLTGIKEVEKTTPLSFQLEQNYPNPFNPSTNIRFRISDYRSVSLKVYDVLGKEVAALVDEHMKPGTYETSFSPMGLASGIYYYTLSTGSYTETKKLILMK